MRKKRATSDEPIIIDTSSEHTTKESVRQLIQRLVKLVDSLSWNYKTNKQLYLTRDKAFLAFLFLTGLRVSEAVQIRLKQIYNGASKIMVVSVATLKHSKQRDEIDLPKIGSLSKLTAYMEEWLPYVTEQDNYLFPRGSAFGVNFKQYDFDYVYAAYGELGNTHRISLGMKF